VIGYEHFDSTEKFLYELEKRPIIRGICGRAKSSESPGGDGGWRDTKDYATAFRKGEKGDPEEALKIKPREAELINHGYLNKVVHDYAGDNVDVGLYLSGEPECMMSLRKRGKPIINILINISASCFVEGDVIRKRGKAILEIMSGLEIAGYGVEITVTKRVTGYDNKHVLRGYRCDIKVKDSKEYFNIEKLAYWLISNSVLRRLMFRYSEQTPEIIQEALGTGYGAPRNLEQKELDEMPDCVYFPIVTDNDDGNYQKAINQILETYKV
jgi:hypothetical protein